ncbi:MAG: hypothetical protein V4637_15050, partial [Pseudomonadota bacterium]
IARISCLRGRASGHETEHSNAAGGLKEIAARAHAGAGHANVQTIFIGHDRSCGGVEPDRPGVWNTSSDWRELYAD